MLFKYRLMNFKEFIEINYTQFIIGFIALIIGTIIYLIDRPPENTYFVYKSVSNLSFYGIFPKMFGRIGNNLPSFFHAFSFILLTTSFMTSTKMGCFMTSLCWFFIDAVFELGQKFDKAASNIVPDWFSYIPYLENTKNYFIAGTFDIFDLLAVVLGSILAFLISIYTLKDSVKPQF
ncbi:MAG: hypothetical protein HQK76_06795 [Desulfobacterales bacterium]|nr:hypothetical protein [Desulfobacterales bacterium]